MIPWWVASIVANVAITGCEYLNRAGGYETFGQAILRTGPLILVAQWALWRSWSGAPSFLLAWATFSLGGLFLRVLSARFLLGEPLGWRTLAGVVLVAFGAHLVRSGAPPSGAAGHR